jgi:hypothetical protein
MEEDEGHSLPVTGRIGRKDMLLGWLGSMGGPQGTASWTLKARVGRTEEQGQVAPFTPEGSDPGPDSCGRKYVHLLGQNLQLNNCFILG